MSEQKVKPGGTIRTATVEEIAELLQEFGQATHIAFGADRIERTLENWPVIGQQRKVRVGAMHGTNNFVVAAATYTDLTDANHGRGGLSIINIGANPCFVFLSKAQDAQAAAGAVASGYLAANGGAWDGKLGDAEWVGPVSVLSASGTTLVWAEV